MPSQLSEALLGSAQVAGLGLDSDLDLCVEGLSGAALLEAMALLAEAELASVPPEQRLPVDLVRLESLPPHWRQRLPERSRLLA